MEEKALRLIAQVGLIGVGIYVIAAVMGKGGQVHIKKHASVAKQDPTSIVWNNSPVQGPNANPNRGAMVTGYVGLN